VLPRLLVEHPSYTTDKVRHFFVGLRALRLQGRLFLRKFHGGEVLVLALLREAAPLDVGEALLFSIRGAPRLHDGLGVGGRGGGGGAAHLCWSCRELLLMGVCAALG